MKPNINFKEDYRLTNIVSKEFVLFLKEEIKTLVADQKIAKRDRKDSRHPCPEKRKYTPSQAYWRVLDNRSTLNFLHNFYYFLRHNKGWDWGKAVMTDRWGKRYLKITELTPGLNYPWPVGNDMFYAEELHKIIYKYCNRDGE
jgi:hypothetical protein